MIVIGAGCYRWLIGPFEFTATNLSKANMFIQISFCVLVLVAQILPSVPPESITFGTAAVLFITAASGCDYVLRWSARAIAEFRTRSR